MKKLSIIIMIIIALIIIIGWGTLIIANAKCEKICDKEEALTYDLIPGGGWITIKNDVCVCYLPDSIKAFKLGEYENKRIS